MSEEEFEVILAELRQLRKAFSESVGEIVHQQTEIRALQWLLQSKGVATALELEDAKVEGARQVNQILAQNFIDDSGTPVRPAREGGNAFSHRGHRRRRTIP